MSVDNRLWRKKQLRWFGAGFHRRDRLLGFLLFLPVLVWISAVVLYPMVVSVLLSFQNARFTAAGASWVGLRNYSRILADRNFWTIARNTLTWTVGNYAVQMGAGLAVALLLNQRFKGASVLRTWIIVPWVIPTVAMCIMWIWMLNASVGVINHIFLRIGLLSERMSFLGTPTTAMLTTILLNSWRWFPLITVVLLAAMQSVPEELYEAAEVDITGGYLNGNLFTMGSYVKMRGNPDASSSLIYAPNAKVEMTGGAFVGAVIAQTFEAKGNSEIVYPEGHDFVATFPKDIFGSDFDAEETSGLRKGTWSPIR